MDIIGVPRRRHYNNHKQAISNVSDGPICSRLAVKGLFPVLPALTYCPLLCDLTATLFSCKKIRSKVSQVETAFLLAIKGLFPFLSAQTNLPLALERREIVLEVGELEPIVLWSFIALSFNSVQLFTSCEFSNSEDGGGGWTSNENIFNSHLQNPRSKENYENSRNFNNPKDLRNIKQTKIFKYQPLYYFLVNNCSIKCFYKMQE